MDVLRSLGAFIVIISAAVVPSLLLIAVA